MFLRICTVPYYNTLPLTWFLNDFLPDHELTRDYPATLAQKLDSGQADIAMMPVASMAMLENSVIVSNAAIACHDAVKSVMIYSQKPLEQIRTLALDYDSRTSVALAQILLREYFQNNRYVVAPLLRTTPLDEIARQFDACVVIGDRALTYQSSAWQYAYDLGTLWYESTGLPFVFAAWVTVRDEKIVTQWRNSGVIDALEKTRDCGVANMKTIAAATVSQNETSETPVPFPVTAETLELYYKRYIAYTLTEAHHRGLQLFFELGRKHQLLGS